MIKDFKTYIKEGRMGRLVTANETSFRKEDELTEEEVKSYLHIRYAGRCEKITIRYEGNKPIVDIEGDFYFREDITEIPFQFGKVTGRFDCAKCKNLTSLKGCPKEVGGTFDCSDCENLTSLEGCPKNVGEGFWCNNCGAEFTKKEIRSLCDVKEEIINH